MFNHVGAKIKLLAKIICWIGIGTSVIFGISFSKVLERLNGEDSPIIGITTLGIIAVGSFISWLLSLISYGFGELVENSTILAESIDLKSGTNASITENDASINASNSVIVSSEEIKDKKNIIKLICPYCHKVNYRTKKYIEAYNKLKCDECNKSFSFEVH